MVRMTGAGLHLGAESFKEGWVGALSQERVFPVESLACLVPPVPSSSDHGAFLKDDCILWRPSKRWRGFGAYSPNTAGPCAMSQATNLGFIDATPTSVLSLGGWRSL